MDIKEKIKAFPRKPSSVSFKRKVFKAVSSIPLGEVRSYKWVAKQAGKPQAARAVGALLKRNRNLFVVPCHRVIASDGSIGGYVLGKKVKKRLLELEKQLTQKG